MLFQNGHTWTGKHVCNYMLWIIGKLQSVRIYVMAQFGWPVKSNLVFDYS